MKGIGFDQMSSKYCSKLVPNNYLRISYYQRRPLYCHGGDLVQVLDPLYIDEGYIVSTCHIEMN
jgi:hypothetical protein